MICPNCGKTIGDHDRYCSYCGYKLTDQEMAEGRRARQVEKEELTDDIPDLENVGPLDPSVTEAIDDYRQENGIRDPYEDYQQRTSAPRDPSGQSARNRQTAASSSERKNPNDRRRGRTVPKEAPSGPWNPQEGRRAPSGGRRMASDYGRRSPGRRPSGYDEEPVRRGSKGKILMIAFLTALVLVIAVLVFFLVRSRNQRNADLTSLRLDSFLDVSVQEEEGRPERYKATSTFDSTAFAKVYGDEIVFIGTQSDRKKLAPDARNDAELLARACIGGSLDQSSGLTKDDEITFKWELDQERAEKFFGVKLEASDQTYTMERLIEAMPKVEVVGESFAETESKEDAEAKARREQAEKDAANAVQQVWKDELVGDRQLYLQAKQLVDALNAPESASVKEELQKQLAAADEALNKKQVEEEEAKRRREEEERRLAEERAREEEARRQQTRSGEGQLFPESSDALISHGRIEALSDAELQRAINEMYARHGYAFKDDAIRRQFEQYSWYNPSISDMGSIQFNATERDNLARMSEERNAR